MKKFLTLFVLFLFCAPARADNLVTMLHDGFGTVAENIKMNEFIFKIGGDFNGRFKRDGNETRTGDGVSAAAEYFRYINDYLAFGAGISAQVPRGIQDESGRFGFAPVYAAVKVRSLPQEPYMYGYAVGQIGYNTVYSDKNFAGDLSGGFYWGGGFGIVYQNFIFEFLYTLNTGSVNYKDVLPGGGSVNVDYPKFTFSAGIIF